MATKKDFEDKFAKVEDEEGEGETEEVTAEHVEEALNRYAEDYRGKSYQSKRTAWQNEMPLIS
jgi:hypothetical protein